MPSLKKKQREERKSRRAKRPKMKARWIGEGDGRKLVGRNEAGTKNGEGQERENQRNKTTMLTQKLGWWKQNLGMLKWKTEKETKTRENDKPRVVLEKGPWAETKTTFATFAQPKTTERETKNKTPSDAKKVTTTVRRKPNKNQQEKERRKRQAWKQ